jgi:hypothetical protein
VHRYICTTLQHFQSLSFYDVKCEFARLTVRVFKSQLLQTLTNALWDPIPVLEMQIVQIPMVHSNAIAKLGFLEMGKSALVYLDNVLKDLTLLTRLSYHYFI